MFKWCWLAVLLMAVGCRGDDGAPRAFPVVFDAATSADEARLESARAMDETGDRGATPATVSEAAGDVRSGEAAVWSEASGIAANEVAASWPVIEAGLADGDYATRLTAVEALGAVCGERAIERIAARLGDPEPDVRVAAIRALDGRREARAIALLRSVRDDEEEQLGLRALAAAALLTPDPASMTHTRCAERKTR
jgi:HEAT repeat protein